jgi:hypothetical protein
LTGARDRDTLRSPNVATATPLTRIDDHGTA